MMMKDQIAAEDFRACPVWKYNPDTESYSDVQGLDDVPGDLADLRISAQFAGPSGVVIDGAVVGVRDVFAIMLFAGGRSFTINKHALQYSRDQVSKFLMVEGLSEQLSFETLFPLRFKTRWSDGGVFNDFEGVFDMQA